MSEPDQKPAETESTPAPVAVEVEADQAVVNTAPDGGGIDNNE
jgi:hypothetical protein